MKKDFSLKQEDFDALLDWLSANRDEAGRHYETIRKGLIRFFRFRGCPDPEILADETINRVALKISTFDSLKNVKTITYFYGFAAKIYLEYTRSIPHKEIPWDPDSFSARVSPEQPDLSNNEIECLEDCLASLSPEDSSLVIQYYGQDKQDKFNLRKKIAQNLNLKMAALHTKVYRIRSILKSCINECLKKKNL